MKTNTIKTPLGCALAALHLLALALPVYGQTSWQNTDPEGGSWHTPGNWTAGVPAGNKTVIDNGGLALLSGSDGTTRDMNIGETTTGNRLEIAGVSLTSRTIHIGENSGSGGTLHLRTGAVLEVSSQFFVGNAGDGWLVIDPGATLKSIATTQDQRITNDTASHASVTIRGTWEIAIQKLDVGFRGMGDVTIGAGGLVDVGSTGTITMGENNATSASGTLNLGGAVVSGVAATAEAAGRINAANLRGGSTSGTGGTGTINFNHTDTRYELINSDEAAINIIGNAKTTVNLYSGTTVLAGDNTYKGGTNVYGGTLLANHEGTGSSTGTAASAVSVHAAGTLGGIGFIDGDTTVEGTLAPGDAEKGHGILKFRGNLSLGTTSETIIRASGDEQGIGYDAFSVAGTLTLGGTLKVQLEEGFSFTGSESVVLTIFDAGTLSGSFAALDLAETFDAMTLQWDVSDLYENGTLSVTAAAIPEPQAFALLAGGAGALLLIRRKTFFS